MELCTYPVPRRMANTRILIANEPRSYREVISVAVQQLRPQVEVVVVEPEELDVSVERFHPDLVVCSRATDRVRSDVPVWVELYQGLGARSVVNVEGEEWAVDDIELSDLLSIVDRAGSV